MCLNEYHLILLLGGAFVGLSHSLLGVIHNMNYVSFTTVQVCVLWLISMHQCSSIVILYLHLFKSGLFGQEQSVVYIQCCIFAHSNTNTCVLRDP